MKYNATYFFFAVTLLIVGFACTACRGRDIILPPEKEQKGDTVLSDIVGFYLLNEGNMGANKATLDYYDYSTATYTRNIYAAANPSVAQSLGDVGNDLAIYGGKLYATINCSNLVEVMDARTAKHLATIEIPNCRYLAFADGYGYCTSYAGPVQIGNARIGYVAKFDTTTLQIVDTCHVGFQPDGLDVVGGRLYVANSGGYLAPDYDNTVSVVDLSTFTLAETLEVAPNLHHVCVDRHHRLWLNSRGDYYGTPSQLFCLTPSSDASAHTIDTLDLAVSNFTILGDTLYFHACAFNYITFEEEVSCGMIDIRTKEVLSKHLITDSTTLVKPYGIAVHPTSRDIYITDAGNYVTPGALYCFSPQGKCRWSVRTGDIPNAIVFLHR